MTPLRVFPRGLPRYGEQRNRLSQSEGRLPVPLIPYVPIFELVVWNLYGNSTAVFFSYSAQEIRISRSLRLSDVHIMSTLSGTQTRPGNVVLTVGLTCLESRCG